MVLNQKIVSCETIYPTCTRRRSSFTLFRMSLSFQEASDRVDAFIRQFKEGYFPPLLMLARLTEETGEIARVIAHQNGKTPKTGESEGDLEMELADLLFVMVCMANQQGISLERGFDRMMDKIEKRDGKRWTPIDRTDEV